MLSSTQLAESEALWQQLRVKESILYPFSSHAWHSAWHRIVSPESVVRVYSNASVFVPLVIENGTAHFSGGEEIADYQDAYGDESQKRTFWEELLATLKDEGIQKMVLRNIPATSPTIEILGGLGALAQIEDSTPTMMLPATEELYLGSLDRKDRHEFKRKIKKFELTYPDTTFSVSNTIDTEALLTLMKKDADKANFLTPKMEEFFYAIPTLADVTPLQANIVTLAGDLISTVLLFAVDKTVLLYNSGFDASYQGAGFYLKAKTILWAIQEGYIEYNFLQGKERYKYELGGKDLSIYTVEHSL
jgi:CelD/BcsL family acetyltransferase involved in cellulose biosynthesis